MPSQFIDQPNPPPEKSHLPDDVLKLAVSTNHKGFLSDKDRNVLQKFRRAADYLAAAMIFLKDNVLLQETLTHDHVRPRLLGHWGTCPGLVLVYAHINRLLSTHTDLRSIFVVGPGHGAPAILAGLWLEDSLGHFYPSYTQTSSGLRHLISSFSVPGGFPSHISAEVPGSIHEGGELGYALAVAFGAVFDKPDLVVVCVIGDGEAETGPTATAWHGYKYLDPAESGAVIPILHVNGFKISERTIFGCMDDKEIVCLFSGYGYQVRFVEDLENIDDDMAAAMDWALSEIRKIQKAAREGNAIVKPRWPVIIMRTPKGWGCPAQLGDKLIEGSFHSHQVPLPAAKKDEDQLKLLEGWLKSYNVAELIDSASGRPNDEITSIIPKDPERKLGQVPETYKGYTSLDLPDWHDFASSKSENEASCMESTGEFISKVIERNGSTFRIFSPDELESNKLNPTLAATGRNFQWDQFSRSQGGRVIEILSEHTCQGFMQGYTLTGRTAMFPSYESFLGIVQTMMVQYLKFNKMGQETNWRGPLPSVNYLETSTWTRQEHNGFSHHSFLNLKPAYSRVYFPPDANCILTTLHHCLNSKNYVNLVVASKHPTPIYLSPDEAQSHCQAGATIWKFASADDGINPDVVLCAIGTETTFEVISAALMLRQRVPELRVRVVNVTDLMVLNKNHSHSLDDDGFASLFTEDKVVIVNYHGYAGDVKGLLFGRKGVENFTVEGYSEEGTTTSPFDMMLRNNVSRYHVAAHAVQGASLHNPKVNVRRQELVNEFTHEAEKVKQYIFEHGEDPEGCYDVPKFS
ncbi:hypothetical protein Dda_3352 [Drechslerella dactyloides]|uniref:D-xylulose 5-phosphate/D-fructose 6-phosphate phosphoketolase n=1 Tax=Drechslerella dactyloides TaxID=74499 RepID=A0AAD6NK94_DREDA|nr:hypothetical protein Dda_3352 [Drechslerella dactyloides]